MAYNGILSIIERQYALNPDGVCFYMAPGMAPASAAIPPTLPAKAEYRAVTFSQLRERASRLSRAMNRMGIERGSWCASDMGNCPAFVYLLVAAAIGGFSIAALNTRLTDREKAERLATVRDALKLDGIAVLDERAVEDAIANDVPVDAEEAMDPGRWMKLGIGALVPGSTAVAMFTSGTSGRPKAAPLSWGNLVGAAEASNVSLNKPGEGLWQLALPMYHVGGLEIAVRSIMNGNPFILYRKFDARQILGDAERFGATHVSVVDKMLQDMLAVDDDQAKDEAAGRGYTEGKLANAEFEPEEGLEEPLGLKGAAPEDIPPDADDPFAGTDPFDMQLEEPTGETVPENAGDDTVGPEDGVTADGGVMPDAGIAGGIGNRRDGAALSASESYRAPSAATLLAAVPDPIDVAAQLGREQDIARKRSDRSLARYQCILLGGAAPNAATLHRAVDADARVYASYGMTETCSQVASRLVTRTYDNTLTPLPGYEVAVVAPDATGRGQLAVKGPGVIPDYLNAHARFTADGFFLTGDTATMVNRCIRVEERTEDMFVSGGENVYPEEIRSKLLQVPGVTDAYVFGDEDAEWGRRPVAVVEASAVSKQPGFNLQLMADEVDLSLSTKLSRLYRPDRIVVVPDFPRAGIGKTDRRALRRLYQQRIDVRKVEIWQVKQPFVHAVQTPKAKLRDRESLLVRVTDWAGRTGIGEGVAFSTDWYLPETIDDDAAALRETLVPLVEDHVFVHPSQVSVLFRAAEGAVDCPMACSALESAIWDLYGKVVGRSIANLIGGRRCVSEPGSLHAAPAGWVPGGAVVGMGSKREVVAQVRDLAAEGYTRVKMKVKPGHGLEAAREVHGEFPDLVLMLDANQSFTEDDVDELLQLDALGAACIEEPLDPHFRPKVGPQDFWDRLVRLQRDMSTPICLDESWTNAEDLKRVLQDNPELRCVAVKIAKFGGVQPALEFYWWAHERGIALWMGGMFDTGVSKRLHAAFATLPGMNIPGDISDTSRYFGVDVCNPPFKLEGGMLQVNPEGHECGLGCDLDDIAIEGLLVREWVIESK